MLSSTASVPSGIVPWSRSQKSRSGHPVSHSSGTKLGLLRALLFKLPMLATLNHSLQEGILSNTLTASVETASSRWLHASCSQSIHYAINSARPGSDGEAEAEAAAAIGTAWCNIFHASDARRRRLISRLFIMPTTRPFQRLCSHEMRARDSCGGGGEGLGTARSDLSLVDSW